MARKKFPCPECNAVGYQAHNPSCYIGQQRSRNARRAVNARIGCKKVKARKPSRARRVPVTSGASVAQTIAGSSTPLALRNEIALVVDRSGSMAGIHRETVDVLNEQIENIKHEARSSGQETFVTLYFFNEFVDTPIFRRVPAHQLRRISYRDYVTSGMTALLDATGTAIRDLECVPLANDDNTSFLVNVITDGLENRSREFGVRELTQLMKRVTATDRWSFVFNCPPRNRGIFTRLGVPAGNVREWNNDAAGAADMTMAVNAGMSQYFSDRAAGQTKTRSFFQSTCLA